MISASFKFPDGTIGKGGDDQEVVLIDGVEKFSASIRFQKMGDLSIRVLALYDAIGGKAGSIELKDIFSGGRVLDAVFVAERRHSTGNTTGNGSPFSDDGPGLGNIHVG